MHDEKWNDISFLYSQVSENKRAKIEAVVAQRTRYATVVLEHITQPHNASAVVRSCDILGIQDMHIIEGGFAFTPQNAITKGAGKWVDIYRYPTTDECFTMLKKQGYRIVATTPHERGYTLSALPLDRKIALVFGTEGTGLSPQAFAQADDYVTIPMFGFTESFNISVSVSICLYHIMTELRTSSSAWHLTASEKEALQRHWLKKLLHMIDNE